MGHGITLGDSDIYENTSFILEITKLALVFLTRLGFDLPDFRSFHLSIALLKRAKLSSTDTTCIMDY